MKASKDAVRTARRIYSLCQTDGRINEANLRIAVEKLVADKPRDYRGVLSTLHRLVRLEELGRKAHIESAVDLSAEEKSRIESSLNDQYGGGLSFTYSVDADLLGGTRIRVGNDVWDGSVKSRLDRLSNAF